MQTTRVAEARKEERGTDVQASGSKHMAQEQHSETQMSIGAVQENRDGTHEEQSQQKGGIGFAAGVIG